MLQIDMRTVLIIFVLVNYICVCLMALTVKANQKRFAGVELFLTNFVFQSAGMTLALMRSHIPQLISVIVANLLMFSGVVIFAFGAGRFTRRSVSRPVYLLYLTVFTGGYTYFTYITPDIRMRTMMFSGMLLPVFTHIAYMLFRPADSNNRQHCTLAGVTFTLFAMLYMTRFCFAFTGDGIDNYFETSSPDTIFNIFTLLLTILLIYSIQHMINNRLFSDFEQLTAEQAAMLTRMEEMATKDHLTGVYNRRKIEEIIRYEIGQHERYGKPLSLILCDIDYFKNINDSWGHDIGDEVIMHTTGLISTNKREVDNVGRWGGEEFIIVTPQTALKQAVALAERFRHLCGSEQPDATPAGLPPVTLSFGVAQYAQGMTLEAFVKSVDIALYRAKERGRNRVESVAEGEQEMRIKPALAV